jgi:hypothetical protein
MTGAGRSRRWPVAWVESKGEGVRGSAMPFPARMARVANRVVNPVTMTFAG